MRLCAATTNALPSVVSVAAALVALLMAPSASAQLYTTTTSATNWVGSARWSSGTAGPFTSTWTDYSDARFVASGTYMFQRLIPTGTANLGNVTMVPNTRVAFAQSSGQSINFITGTGGVATFNVGDGSQIDFGSIITAAGQGNGYVKTGNGTLTLTGGLYSGGFTLNAGNVVARNNNAVGIGPLTINGGAIGAITNFIAPSSRDGGISIGGDFQLGISGSAGSASSTAHMTFTGTGNTVNLGGATRTITLGNSGSMTFGGVISNGALTLTRTAEGANGQFTLSGGNTFAGDLTLDGVRVNASGNNRALGRGGVILGGTTGYATTLNIGFSLTLANAITFADAAGLKSITNTTANATVQGLVTNGDSTGTIRIGAGTGLAFTLAGGLGGSGSTGWFFGGSGLPGTIVISSSSTYSGTADTTVDSAVVTLAANQALPQNNLTLTSTLAGTRGLDLGGFSQTVKQLAGGTSTSISSSGSPGTLVVGASNVSSTFDGAFTGGGVVLRKIGSGSLTLTGSNSNANDVIVSAGTLLVTGSIQSSNVTVESGATLGGVLFVASADLQAGSTTLMQIVGSGSGAGTAGVDYDRLVVTTSSLLSYGGTLDLSFANTLDFADGTTFDLFNFSGVPNRGFNSVVSTGSGTYSGLTFTGLGGVWTALAGSQQLTFTESTGQLSFMAAVPEPSTWASLLAGIGIAGWFSRRRQR
jgi:autotransporter-associated beta strand protein